MRWRDAQPGPTVASVTQASSSPRRGGRALSVALLLAVVALVAGVGAMSWRLDRTQGPLEIGFLTRDVVIAVGLLMAAGLVYLSWLAMARRRGGERLVVILFAGLAMRGMLFGSLPLLEDDHWRYLWDGGVVAAGLDPYAHTPERVLAQDPTVPADLLTLARDPAARHVLANVNHPEIRTIYPPVTQALFAASHWVSPWSLWPLRMGLLIVGLVTTLVIVKILESLSLPRWWVGVYWCNPLAAVLTVGACHIDILAAGLAVAAVWLMVAQKPRFGMGILALGVGAKLWPLALRRCCSATASAGSRDASGSP